ncbi:hypothetical protein [Cognatishimia activa]|uniref:hypothetical protein n=1 Tax=Cognatishimia activa TaxID=1715691 RepID=UPI002230108B|nr:hypothetical protein [Cognatishimia activa]UZD92460.1 hypothetical protein M0D42_07585 [Cognatishimia activa]
MTSEEILRSFMQDYHRVLNARDFGGLVEFLDFPFEIAALGTKLKLQNAADIVEAFTVADKVHAERGVHRVRREVAFAHVADLREAIVGTHETAIDARGHEIVSWRSSYLLERKNGVWRLTKVNATNHDEAWEKLGEASLHAASESSLC